MAIVLTQPPTPRLHRPSFTTFVSDSAHDTWSSCTSPRVEIQAYTATKKSRRLPSLPAELHLEIIDVIARRVPRTPIWDEPYDPVDLDTLFACALVCKLWLNTARTGIWAGVRLSDRKKSMSFIGLLHGYGRESDPTWTLPSFGRYISQLSIRETRGNAWDPKWLDDALPHLAEHLTRVRGLEIEHVTWEYLSSRSRTACLEAFKHAKMLTLRGFEFHTTRDMYNFLGEFAELEVLTLDGLNCDERKRTTWLSEGTIKLPPRGLKEVGLRGVPVEPVLEWMIAGANSGSMIKSVRMGGVGVSEANIVGRFLREVGESLKKVYIGFDTDFVERGDALVREIELAENTNLEEFHIFGLVVPSPPPVDPFEEEPTEQVLTALTQLLSQIRSRMRMLSLALYPADVRAMNAIDFEGLSEVFGRNVWSDLDEVRVVIANKGECGLKEVVRERLGELDARGVLKVNVGFDEREVL